MDHEKGLQFLAGGIKEMLAHLYGKQMGFALIIFEFSDVGIGDYISNAQRSDMIKALRECADRLETKEYIPKTIGEA
jgi:hypothetical protein